MNFLDVLPLISPANVVLVSVVLAALLVYVPYALVGVGRLQVGLDLAAPRAMFDKLPDYAKRATWAHQNSFESFLLYAPAALMAFVVALPVEQAVGNVLIYLIARLGYSAFYVLNVPVLRSLCWVIGMVSIFSLYWASCQFVLS